MAISFDKALGIHQKALEVRVGRAEILADNLANADTPGFKARDIDFKSVLAGISSGDLAMQRSHRAHLSDNMEGGAKLLYRNPTQPSIDGNTVDSHTEIAEYSKNALSFQSSFQFLNSKFKGLVSALRGD